MYILYKTTNKITNQIYIGVHNQKTSDPYEFDGYLGSGNWTNLVLKAKCRDFHPDKLSLKDAINLYGRENFHRETIYISNDIKEIYRKESEIVTENFVKSSSNYNLIPGGKIPPNHFGYKWINNNFSECRISEESIIPDGFHKGRLPIKDSTKNKLRIITLKNGNKPPIHSKENGYWSDERLKKTANLFSIVNKNRKYSSHCQERKNSHSKRMKGANNPAFGSKFIWINDGISQKRWTGLIDEIPDDFRIGTLVKGKKFNKHEILKCPYCKITGGSGSMKRWHFDNCKNKSEI